MSSPCILCLCAPGLVQAALWCLWCLPYPEESKGQISVISIFTWNTQPPKTQSSAGSFNSILGALPRRHRAWVSADWTLVLFPGLCGSSTGLQLKGYSSSLKQLGVYVLPGGLMCRERYLSHQASDRGCHVGMLSVPFVAHGWPYPEMSQLFFPICREVRWGFLEIPGVI